MAPNENVLIFVGSIVHCIELFSVRTIEKGFVIVKKNKIIAVDHVYRLSETKELLGIENAEEIVLEDNQILIPGLIDTHLHAPQYLNVGLGYDKPLLDWLKYYTLPLEKKHEDVSFASTVYDAVVQTTLSHGTTTACYFGTIYKESTLVLADSAIAQGQRAFIGKVNMINTLYHNYVESAEDTIANTISFVKEVLEKKSELVKPIITPRFAVSLDMKTMKKLAEIAKEYNLNIQTHISENKEEIRLVNECFNSSYADVYDQAGLLTDKTVLAHGIHLEDVEMKLIAERGSSVAHCPESNTYLQSGMCDVKKLVHFGIHVGLGTDISGGAFPSIVSAMRAAIQTSIHLSYSKKDYDPLNCYDVFYLATLGGAKALALEDVTGNFQVGKDFDALVVDMNVEHSGTECLHEYSTIELLQKFIFLGDDRNIVKVYVAGNRVK